MCDEHEIELRGCSLEPLMSYLKAIGILRLVNEQKDPEATGCWRHESFMLRSELDRKALLAFFLDEYRPTPIVTPWAGGSGFFPKDDSKALEAIAASSSPRLASYRDVIKRARAILQQAGMSQKPNQASKDVLLRRLRRDMPDCFLPWMDAAMVLESDGPAYAPLLGTGGNDGRLDFSHNFMERLVELGLVNGRPSDHVGRLLNNALFGRPTAGLSKSALGQFAPGRAGGPNATQGMEGKPLDNPWDFVLMIEGTLMLAGAAVRRYGAALAAGASFPFTVRAIPVGSAVTSEAEVTASRGELWLPVWDRPASANELRVLFAEGRAELAGQPARDALQFARAVATLGVDRGVNSFVRYGFLKRYGRTYLAVPLERFPVPGQRVKSVDLVREIDPWLDRYRQACGSTSAPARHIRALRRIDSRIYDLCRYGRREQVEALLAALGRAERELAVTRGQRSGAEFSPPIGGLSAHWIEAAYDGSVEFDLAVSLASVYTISEDGPGMLRQNLEPVRLSKGRWQWSELAHAVVWTEASLSASLSAILERRLMEALRTNSEDLGLSYRRGARLQAVSAFLAGEVDEERLGDLLWGSILIDQRTPLSAPNLRPQQFGPLLPRAYALLKLLFLPRPLVPARDDRSGAWRWRLAGKGESGVTIPPEPRILDLLRTGRIREACRVAYDRLRASGLTPLPGPRSSGVPRASDWEADPSLVPSRLAAALLIPVSASSVPELVQLVTRPEDELSPIASQEEGGIEL